MNDQYSAALATLLAQIQSGEAEVQDAQCLPYDNGAYNDSGVYSLNLTVVVPKPEYALQIGDAILIARCLKCHQNLILSRHSIDHLRLDYLPASVCLGNHQHVGPIEIAQWNPLQ